MSSGFSATDSLPPENTPRLDNDPPPEAPIEPDFDSCCGSGCGEQCVFDIYYALRAQYQVDYAAWQARQAAAPKATS